MGRFFVDSKRACKYNTFRRLVLLEVPTFLLNFCREIKKTGQFSFFSKETGVFIIFFRTFASIGK